MSTGSEQFFAEHVQALHFGHGVSELCVIMTHMHVYKSTRTSAHVKSSKVSVRK